MQNLLHILTFHFLLPQRPTMWHDQYLKNINNTWTFSIGYYELRIIKIIKTHVKKIWWKYPVFLAFHNKRTYSETTFWERVKTRWASIFTNKLFCSAINFWLMLINKIITFGNKHQKNIVYKIYFFGNFCVHQCFCYKKIQSVYHKLQFQDYTPIIKTFSKRFRTDKSNKINFAKVHKEVKPITKQK